jgi:hypothetical protein
MSVRRSFRRRVRYEFDSILARTTVGVLFAVLFGVLVGSCATCRTMCSRMVEHSTLARER